MLYFVIAILLFISFVVLAGIFLPIGEPNMEIGGVIDKEHLKARIADLAVSMNSAAEGKSYLSSHLIRATVNKTYKKLSDKAGKKKLLDFEKWIFDNFYKLSEVIDEQRNCTFSFNRLPGYKNLPRIYHLAQAIVKGSGGAVNEALIKECVDTFNEILPLGFTEIEMLPKAIDLALLEYIAIFCARSNVINDKFNAALKDISFNKYDVDNADFTSYAYTFTRYADGELLRRFDEFCTLNGKSVYDRAENFLSACVRYTGAVSSAIKSLYALPPSLNDEFLLEICPLNNYLCSAKVVYEECTTGTKYIYLRRIAKKAKNKNEIAYANSLVNKAISENKDLAYYILPRPFGKFAVLVYTLIVVGYTISNCMTVFMYLPQFKIAAAIIFIPISLSLVVMFATSVTVRVFARRYMPRLRIKDGPKTLIVFPTLVYDRHELDDMIQNMLTVSCANSEELFCYGLLIDLPQSKRDVLSDEEIELINYARSRFEALGERFKLLIRKRQKVEGEEKYQGKEKKRGAILALNDLILNGVNDEFEVSCPLGDIKYVITLDSDTMINCGFELVEIMEHPYNADKAVVSLNMKSRPPLNTPFAEIMSDSVGLNNYSNFIADASYDIFGSGNYTGKGIYRVKEFTAKVSDVFMDNRVLSHDFVEGAIAGCGCSGENALDNYPKTFSSYLTRNLRWLRGDYQLFPFLFTKIKNKNGKYIRNPVKVIARLHILDNIILGLIPISSAILLIMSLFASFPLWLTVVAFALNALNFLGALRMIFFRPKRVWVEFLRQLISITCLPVIAYNHFKAIAVTIYRLIVKKNLLVWNVFAHSNGRVSFLPNVVAAAVYVAACFIFGFKWTFAVMGALFMSGIILIIILDTPEKEKKFDEKNITMLKKLAADTWIFFEKMLKKENNFLPCDNYQEENVVGYAKRTSPTDIGFMITALVSAHEMEFITDGEFEFYAAEILSSIERADKWRGNLYNWIDINTLCRLNGYVSAVDSGNLLASLIMLRNSSCGEISKRADKLIQNTDIAAFFDESCGLLKIGYDDANKSFDPNHYDMLGSEAMLTYLVGIGLGKLKSSCFKNLSSRCVKYKGVSLYSWTGGAFEYMMSSLYFAYNKDGLLYNSALSVLKANAKYAKNNDMPFWGTSESQYSAIDEYGNYQYKAFGVSEISLSGERRKAVVSPYASLLFLPFAPDKVIKNMHAMYECGQKGDDGLYESYDDGVIRTYMTHHQGMILASICNFFYNDRLIKIMASPDMRAASLLITMTEMPKARKKKEYPYLTSANTTYAAKRTSPPTINLMSGGKYSVLIDSAGNGYSYYSGKFVSRYYDHNGGMKIFASHLGKRMRIGDAYFSEGRAEFISRDDVCEIKQTAIVLPAFDGEGRKVEIKNLTGKKTEVVIESYMEVALAPLYADISHKTFSGMFVDTFVNENALFAKRKELILAHFFDVDADFMSNRALFIGRGSGPKIGRVLDPIVSGKVGITLDAYEMKTVHCYNIVSTDEEKLHRGIRILKNEAYFDKAASGAALMAHGYGISKWACAAASKLIFDSSPNLLNGDLPLVAIQTNAITERIKHKLKFLKMLGLFGVRCDIAMIYYGDAITCEKLHEDMAPIKGENCNVIFINKKDDPDRALMALRSSTDLDEIISSELSNVKIMREEPYDKANLPAINYAYKLGMGGFLSDGTYALPLKKDSMPPRPWSNIIANESFGTIITESGGGYTYYANSRQNKLTEWSNDPVADTASEGVVIFEGNKCWSVTRLPICADADYQALHSFGYSEFRCNYNGFYSRERVFIDGLCKFYEVTLHSSLDFDREVTLLFFASPVLGDFAFKTVRNMECDFNGELTVHNLYNNSTMTISSDKEISHYVCHKQAYIDKNGKFFRPTRDMGYEICPAVTVNAKVPPMGSVKVIFRLSVGPYSKTDTELLIRKAAKKYSSLSQITISTGNPALDYLSKWLPYQVLNSRFYARMGFYQAGGAIGFRDQLQDCLTLLYIDPALVKKHIIDCAAHQFETGDVQHWWHPPRTGVRTKISDDRLFLPFITAEYIEFTGDRNILFERAPYLSDMKIFGKDAYGTPDETVSTGTVYEHCMKAIKVSASLGENGLVLMGGGDWNDAMDNVGIKGNGTTVWGSMFLYLVIDKFMPYVKNKKPLFALKNKLKEGINKAFDGEWFTRAYMDDGTVLGSKKSEECNIDLITQSFAYISGCTSKERARLSLLSAASKLVDGENGIIKLLTPPLNKIKAGYICDYPPGVRENGGQYTHGAVWFIMSLFEAGEADYAYSLLNMINPVNHSLTASAVHKYEVEPYVLSGDVYSLPAGKGGWSWYTGAASWYYYVVISKLLGIKFKGDTISVSPNLPSSMTEAAFTVRRGETEVVFKIDNTAKKGEWRIYVGGVGYNTNEILITKSLNNKQVILRRYE